MIENAQTPAPPSGGASMSTTAAVAPTTGAVVGSALGAWLASQLDAKDPLLGNVVATVVTGVVTALFHWAGSKIAALKL